MPITKKQYNRLNRSLALFFAQRNADSEFFKHSAAVADKFENSEEYDLALLALLHDAIEDDLCTIEELNQIFTPSEELIDALNRISRKQGETYSEYIDRVKDSRDATVVKLEDLRQNMLRCVKQDPPNISLLLRYVKATDTLTKHLNGLEKEG